MIVLCNGVFDCLHVGHFIHLLEASKLGDLYVGVTSDKVVRAQKRQAIYGENERVEMLSELPFVVEAFVVDEDDASRVIKEVEPDYFCKGQDYSDIRPSEKEALKEVGGKLFITNTTKYSTWGLIQRVREPLSSVL